MDLRKLEAFLTVANTGKYTDAAEKLFISQSSLSKQMAQMERELGVKLFKKTRNGVELTQAGFDFYSYVRKMLSEYHRAVDRLQMYREGGTYPCASASAPLGGGIRLRERLQLLLGTQHLGSDGLLRA